MVAGVLNTLRLGSEALAVGLYASLLSRDLSNTLPSVLPHYAPSAEQSSRWIATTTSGNFMALVYELSDQQLLSTLSMYYQQAFNHAMTYLVILGLILSVWIARQIRHI